MNRQEQVKAPPYQAWLHWYVTNRCFLDCDYCSTPDRERAPIAPFQIEPLIRTLEATGLIFRISFTGGGEPLLVPNLIEACRELTKKHYVSFNTNLVHSSVPQLVESITPGRILQIHASCHIKAMERAGLLDRFVENYRLCQRRGIPIHAEEVGHPALVSEADFYRNWFATRGVELHFGPFGGLYQNRMYPGSYSQEEMNVLGISPEEKTAHVAHRKHRFFLCNAGFNAAVVDPQGEIFPCDQVRRSMGNIYREIRFAPRLLVCPASWCMCPLYSYDPSLYRKALIDHRLQRWLYDRVLTPWARFRDWLRQVSGGRNWRAGR